MNPCRVHSRVIICKTIEFRSCRHPDFVTSQAFEEVDNVYKVFTVLKKKEVACKIE